jgi:hypothetical protein
MALITDGHLNKSIPLINLLEFGRDYCSDHLGRFFQNKYSPPAQAVNKFVIPAKFITKNEQISFAICVLMNNHIVDLKYLNDILIDWDNEKSLESITLIKEINKINICINNKNLLSVIKSFKKINDEIVIGRCQGRELTPV